MRFLIVLLLAFPGMGIAMSDNQDYFRLMGTWETRTKISTNSRKIPFDPAIETIVRAHCNVDTEEQFERCVVENDDIYALSVNPSTQEQIIRILRMARMRYHKL